MLQQICGFAICTLTLLFFTNCIVLNSVSAFMKYIQVSSVRELLGILNEVQFPSSSQILRENHFVSYE